MRVKPEGSSGVWLIEKDEITTWIQAYPEDRIHCFIGGGRIIIGADWDKESVIEKIAMADRIAILTGAAQLGNMRHALSVIAPDEVYDGKLSLYAFAIGEILESDLVFERGQ